MADETSISFTCTDALKKNAKITIMEKGIKNFQDGYLKIFKMGLERFKKEKEEKKT